MSKVEDFEVKLKSALERIRQGILQQEFHQKNEVSFDVDQKQITKLLKENKELKDKMIEIKSSHSTDLTALKKLLTELELLLGEHND